MKRDLTSAELSEHFIHIDESELLLSVSLFYPRNEGNVDTVEVDLTCVRSADAIRIKYDFDRDGWVVMQPSKVVWDDSVGEDLGDQGWVEAAFLQAWDKIDRERHQRITGQDFDNPGG